MRLLNVEHGRREEERAEQRGARTIQTPPDKINDQDGGEIEQRGEQASNDVNLSVPGLIEQIADEARHENRERAVDEQAIAVIVRIERGTLGIEIPAPFGAPGGRHTERIADPRNGQRRRHHREETFVGMQMLILIPVDAGEAEQRAKDQNPGEQKRREPLPFARSDTYLILNYGVVFHCSIQLVKISRTVMARLKIRSRQRYPEHKTQRTRDRACAHGTSAVARSEKFRANA